MTQRKFLVILGQEGPTPSIEQGNITTTPSLSSQDEVALIPTAEPPDEPMTTVQATIRKTFGGYTVTATMRQYGSLRALTEKTVATHAEAESVVKAFAAAHEVAWEKVEVVSR